MKYYNKYLKYKNKYLKLNNMIGGMTHSDVTSADKKLSIPFFYCMYDDKVTKATSDKLAHERIWNFYSEIGTEVNFDFPVYVEGSNQWYDKDHAKPYIIGNDIIGPMISEIMKKNKVDLKSGSKIAILGDSTTSQPSAFALSEPWNVLDDIDFATYDVNTQEASTIQIALNEWKELSRQNDTEFAQKKVANSKNYATQLGVLNKVWADNEESSKRIYNTSMARIENAKGNSKKTTPQHGKQERDNNTAGNFLYMRWQQQSSENEKKYNKQMETLDSIYSNDRQDAYYAHYNKQKELFEKYDSDKKIRNLAMKHTNRLRTDALNKYLEANNIPQVIVEYYSISGSKMDSGYTGFSNQLTSILYDNDKSDNKYACIIMVGGWNNTENLDYPSQREQLEDALTEFKRLYYRETI